ncbi:hypothetical protein PVAND_006681 [Polypedilum vanderplanki]|uniref:GCN5-related N-acetyltransferase Rv2170-like domain-containing protein n=1 Tax=Polypedilum vanderplanki TaxID=319348 RepID=A0A9J6C4X9_POLVA|nr:hypothetical protein PVAND_006681 [Polypedilum vanderplanki]
MKVVKILKEAMPFYKEIFRKSNWPKHVASYSAFEHFSKRFEKYPEWEHESKVEFLTLNDDKNSDGVFAMIHGPYIYFDTSEAAPYPKLERLLYLLDYSKDKMFISIRDELRTLVDGLMRMRGLEKTYDASARGVYFDVKRDYILEQKRETPEGFYNATLNKEDLSQVLAALPQKSEKCIQYLKTVIEFNPTTGLFKNNGELVAWCMQHEIGALGNLYVKEEFLRRNFAMQILPLQALKIYDQNEPIFGDVLHHNYKSFNLMNKFKHEWLDNISWIGVRKNSTIKNVPFWYYV